jgi:two-component system LytT family response regulator
MKRIRTLIVDDEPLARERVRTLLEGEEEFDVIQECGDGAAAIEAVVKLKPDLVFLDIQMPQIDGFDVIAALDGKNLPMVIFVTAFDQYAVRAFRVHALDYLLKPLDRERFAETLDRIRAHDDTAVTRQRIQRLLSDLQADGRGWGFLPVRSGEGIRLVPLAVVDWIEAAGNYVRIHCGSRCHLLRETMKELERKLVKGCFVRIHRSVIVNARSIREVKTAFRRDYTVVLKSGEELKMSRNYRAALEELIERNL